MFLRHFVSKSSKYISPKLYRSQFSAQIISRTMSSSHIPEGHVEIIEGSARMLYNEKEAVFYNKVQVLNRDLSIQVIRLFAEIVQKERNQKRDAKLQRFKENKSHMDREPFPVIEGISVLDALAATGLRSIRYVKEIPGLRQIVINDLLPEATTAAKENCRLNGVDDSKVRIETGDATMLMYQHRDPAKQFDVIDLDPYGSACPFIDSAVQAVADGGLLIVTCTDAAVLNGNYPEVCFSKYGSMSIKSPAMHEMSLRILLNSLEAAATKYRRYIVPWVSMSIDFYVRVFVRVFDSAAESKESCMKRCMLHQSVQTHSYYLQPIATKTNKGQFTAATQTAPLVCEETGGKMKVGGPFWSEPIHNQEVVDELLRRIESGTDKYEPAEGADPNEVLLPFPVSTANRLTGLLSTMSDELKDVPFYHVLPDLAHVMRSKCPSHLEFKSALINAGYRVSHFHHEPNAIKTDAPNSVVWDIMRAHCKANPVVASKKKDENVTGQLILAREPSIEVSFKVPKCLWESNDKKKIARFPPNPGENTLTKRIVKHVLIVCIVFTEANWGPKRRAGRGGAEGVEIELQKRAAKRAAKKARKLEEKKDGNSEEHQSEGESGSEAEDRDFEPVGKKQKV